MNEVNELTASLLEDKAGEHKHGASGGLGGDDSIIGMHRDRATSDKRSSPATLHHDRGHRKSNGAHKRGGKYVLIGIALFTLLGLAPLYPFNAILSSTDWFEYVLPETSNVSGLLSEAKLITSIVTTFFILAFASPKDDTKVDNGGEEKPYFSRWAEAITTSLTSLEFRTYLGIIIMGAPMLAFALIYPTQTQAIVLSVIVGVGDAMVQTGIFPLAGAVHPRCTAAASLGGAVAGLVAGLVRLGTKAAFPMMDMRLSSSVFFGIATAFMVLCALALYAVTRMKEELICAFFQREYARNCKSVLLNTMAVRVMLEEESETDEELQASTTITEQDIEECQSGKEKNVLKGNDPNSATSQDELPTTSNELDRSVSESSHEQNKPRTSSALMEDMTVYRIALRCAWLPILIQFVNFFISLSLFPGVVLSMTSESLGSYFTTLLVTVYNAGDTLGRLVQLFKPVANWVLNPVGSAIIDSKTGAHLGNRRPRMIYSIVLPCFLRLAFYPLLIFCVNPLYISSDAGRITIVLLFAMSTGWVNSGCFILAPELCRETRHREAASLLVVVSTLLGLGIGSSVGLGIASAVNAK
mmetsp:Transcript_43794/g.93114  ORF Transcript_43794/g.93114 Transcript_43794/m.93114 type:complete len:584 (-) Transcript_43794:225-1976(-)